jgi:hypothetical protein
MRLLGSAEKEICNRILRNNGRNNFLANIIDQDLRGVCILTTHNPSAASLEFTIAGKHPTTDETNAIIARTEKLSLFILQTVNLLKMLEEDGYILLLERGSNSNQPSKFGQCIANLPSVSYTFQDPNVISLLCEFAKKEIYSTEEFVRFCQKGYVPRDEQRFRIQIFVTQFALVVATLALLFNLYINLKNKEIQDTKIEETQFQKLLNSISNLQRELKTNQSEIFQAEKNIDTLEESVHKLNEKVQSLKRTKNK